MHNLPFRMVLHSSPSRASRKTVHARGNRHRTYPYLHQQAEWTRVSGTEWVFTIKADRFLRNMVRAEYDLLQGLDVLVMNALRPQPHNTHQNLKEALDNAQRIKLVDTAVQ